VHFLPAEHALEGAGFFFLHRVRESLRLGVHVWRRFAVPKEAGKIIRMGIRVYSFSGLVGLLSNFVPGRIKLRDVVAAEGVVRRRLVEVAVAELNGDWRMSGVLRRSGSVP